MGVLLRFAWIFGFLSTRRYAVHARKQRSASVEPVVHDCTLARLEKSLFEDRLAVLLFLLGGVILIYTFLYAPHFQTIRSLFSC
jgi:hypothetical protein